MSQWKWCLEDENGKLLTGWVKVGDYWYYLNSNGAMTIGWYKDSNGKWYYLNDNGQMTTGWLQYKDKWYYLYEATNAVQGEYLGTTAYSCTKTLSDGKKYTFDENGVWIENTDLLSDDGAKFIGSWEGFYSHAYEDPYYPGNESWWTIGYGTTYAVTPSAFPNGLNSICTEEQAIGWLKDEAQECAQTIKADLDSKGVSLNQNQLDALISFAYNCGTGALLGSTLYRNIVAGVRDSATLTANFQAWSKANGQTSQGLLKRRTSEAALFLNADYTGNN
ncbi:MAG: cell wall-binding protein [Clostridium beijerinckii]|nr:cell wall-binding protein [Clostridium beijerinckii]